MKTALLPFLAAAVLVACGGAPTTMADNGAPEPPGVDAGAERAVTPDAGGYQPDSGADAPANGLDAGAVSPEGAAEASPDGPAERPDAAPEPARDAAAPDAPPEGAPPVVDAAGGGVDGSPAAPDCTTEACSCATPAERDFVMRMITEVRATFTGPCSAADEPKCGGIQDDPRFVSTLPLACVDGRWTYKGHWYSCKWAAGGPMCTHSCSAAKLCDP